MRIWLLGGFRVSVGARTIEKDAWRLRKAASLVKLLALAPGHRLHRERVMGTLWPELGRKAASNNLRGALHAARRALEPDQGPRYLELQGEQLVLCPGAQLQVDVDTFEEAAYSARRSRDPAACRAAINLYAGELLPGDRHEEWTEGRRETLRQLRLTLLDGLATLEDKSSPAPSIGSTSKEFEGSLRHNLPTPSTSFVGRERELVETKKLLSMTRLLTLTGAGGSGKTRLAREAGDTHRIGVALAALGYAAVLQDDNERATALCEETLAFACEHEDAGEEVVAETLVNLGLAALGQGQHERAISSFDEALAMSQRAGRKASLINTLEGMTSLASAMGEDLRAARLWGAAEAARESTGIALPPGEWALHEPRLNASRSQPGEGEWGEELAEGRTMSLEVAARYAVSRDRVDTPATALQQEPSAGEPALDLSGREREVMVLVARGLTNRQISAHLGISERTAGNHVGRILKKLGLRSRAQIATWATEHQLPTTHDSV
ncbi:MAG: hypothetical protein H0W57_13465 [Rubrobacteraceae bacterium]|nr:hypothetical protein [Rubrobacteraceae bacterium]